MKNKVIAVVGPTASGKTKFAVELAQKIDGEIISADSRLVYKGFDIGTAKPSIEERGGIPHYMIDIAEPEEDYSAGLYANEAKKVINDIRSRGKIPIVAGGTGLYINILLMNYDLPKVEPDYELREQLRAQEDLSGILAAIDPAAAQNIDKNDRKKLIRAIEIVKKTGRPLAQKINNPEYDVEWIGLNYPREVLYERINMRVDEMINSGLVDETKKLLQKHGRIPNLLYTIGYQEVIQYLDGEFTLEEAVDKLKQNTRRYAKRQLTWFRKNPEIKWNVYPEKLKK